MVLNYREIEIGGNDLARLKEVIARATAITKPKPHGEMCHVVRRAALIDGHLVVEFAKDSTNAERVQAASRMFLCARELGVETGSIEFTDWENWLRDMGFEVVDGVVKLIQGPGLMDDEQGSGS